MRRVLLPVSLLVVAVGVFAAMASANPAKPVTTKFSVIEIHKSSHSTRHSFINRGALVRTNDRDDVVGHDVVKFSPRTHQRFEVKGTAFFMGEGTLKVQGGATQGNNTIPIIGGTGEFNGAAGKVKTHQLSKKRTRLTFIFVQ
jgi:hypothetical protein